MREETIGATEALAKLRVGAGEATSLHDTRGQTELSGFCADRLQFDTGTFRETAKGFLIAGDRQVDDSLFARRLLDGKGSFYTKVLAHGSPA